MTPDRALPPMGPDAVILGGGADVALSIQDVEFGSALPKESAPRDPALPSLAVRWALAPITALVRGLFATRNTPVIDRKRDQLEEDLLRDALAQGLPVLGICRGMQLINVALGGSLHKEVESFYAETPHLRTLLPRKRVSIETDSQLAAIVGSSHAHVNALHHQAVDRLGEGLQIAAVDSAGVTQAIESSVEGFLIGVQWHPEYLPQDRQQVRLFRALVAAAASATKGL